MTATYTLNHEHNGIEIYFSVRPEQSVINKLKLHRWRWHSQRRLWYNKQSDDTLALAQSIANMNIQPAPIPNPVVNTKDEKGVQYVQTI